VLRLRGPLLGPALQRLSSEAPLHPRPHEHSFFYDLAAEAVQQAFRRGTLTGGMPPWADIRIANGAEQRLRTHRDLQASREKRALSSASNFTGPGSYDGARFSESVHAESVLPFPVLPLADTGMTVLIPRFSTSSSVAIQATEGAGVSSTDPGDTRVSSAVGTLAGQIDLSQQLSDRAEPGDDEAIRTELVGQLAQARDTQFLMGTGASGQVLGLNSVIGITATSYTDATATEQEAFVQLLVNAAGVATAGKKEATHVLMHPRRRIWFSNWRDTATGVPAVIPWPAEVVQTAAIPTNLGAGTEDEIFLVNANELPIYLGPVTVEAMVDTSLSNTLQVRIQARQYAASSFTRRPEAIGKVTGTGLIAPVID
jgi:hypothetical protein